VLPGSHEGEGMPAVMADDEARALYLTPGGIYTEADIAANGNQTGNQKFRGFVPKHDLKPKVGDKICPITLTKANPQCSWIVGGKTYEFCCPPCVEEFVKLAKEQPEEVKEPADYVKR
jgi:YHS domain-containing protein